MKYRSTRKSGPLRFIVSRRVDGLVLLQCGHTLIRRNTNDRRRLCPLCPYNIGFAPVSVEDIRLFDDFVNPPRAETPVQRETE